MTMNRLRLEPRPDWQKNVESVGMDYHTIDGNTYWDESACYLFDAEEIDRIETVTAELQEICLHAVDQVIRNDWFDRLKISVYYASLIAESWTQNQPSLLGRFDLAYDGRDIKLLEYNADTPTALLEAAVVQWFWLRDLFPEEDQFNSIHERLIRQWPKMLPAGRRQLHFSCVDGALEDQGNVGYLMDTAVQAGFSAHFLAIENIGLDYTKGKFFDLNHHQIETLFKLYPLEWLFEDDFGLFIHSSGIHLIEPPWKIILSNKGILPLLWELFPGHPYLLEAFFEEGKISGDYVSKPFFSREGENVRIHRARGELATPGSYGSEGRIYQRFIPLPCFEGNFPIIGSWVIGGEPAGIGIREDTMEITTNQSRFVPHRFRD